MENEKDDVWMKPTEAARELHMTEFSLKCCMRYGRMDIGHYVPPQGGGKRGGRYWISRKLVEQEKERLGIR